MTEPIAAPNYVPLIQPDPLGTWEKVQAIRLQRQEQEARRRALEGGAAGGQLYQDATKGGGFDPAAYNKGVQGIRPELVPEAVTKSSEAASAAIKAQSESVEANQKNAAYIANSLGVLLATHPKGVPTADAAAVIGSLNALGQTLPLPAAAMTLELVKQPSDKARSVYIAQKMMNNPAIWTTFVDTTAADGTPTKTSVADLIAQTTGLKPPGGPGEGEAAPGDAPATDEPTSGLKPAVAGPSLAQKAAAGAAGTFYSERAQKDIAASVASVDAASNLRTMLEEAKNFRGGPLSDRLYNFLAAANQLTGAELASHSVAAKEVFDKTAAAFAQAQAAQLGGAHGMTDFTSAQSITANPSAHTSDLTRKIVINKLLGGQAAIKAVGLAVAPIQDDYVKLKQFYTDWAEHGDIRVFQYMMLAGDKAARDAMVGAEFIKSPGAKKGHWVGLPDASGKRVQLTKKEEMELNTFHTDLNFAHDKGWLDSVETFKEE